MSKKVYLVWFLVAVVIIFAVSVLAFSIKKEGSRVTTQPELQQLEATTTVPTDDSVETQPKSIVVTAPIAESVVTSPLTVTGQAKGNWYFEASFPVKVIDAKGRVIAQGPARAQGDWMTNDFVPFAITFSFPPPTTATGTVIFQKDNPSGLPQNDASISIPVRFK